MSPRPNKWKKFPDKLDEIYKSADYVELGDLRGEAAAREMTASRKLPGIKKYEPIYPVPEQVTTSTKVVFVALKTHVERLAQHYFETAKIKPGEVGLKAFEEAFQRHGKKR